MSNQESPLDEYVTGVLAPRALILEKTDAGLDAESSGGEDLIADDLGGDAGPDVTSPDALGPSLDPRMRAASMGISFALRDTDQLEPTFDVVVTLGTYAEPNGGGWLRSPVGSYWSGLKCANQILSFDDLPGVRLHIRSRPDRHDASVRRVSLYLVNDQELSRDRGPSCHVFQPQIRVRCAERTQLVPLERAVRARNVEDQRLAVLYRERATMARGHLCSATWRAVDPEAQRDDTNVDDDALFDHWPDGEALWGDSDPGLVQRFSPADARSEFVPVISVNAPDKAWPKEAGPAPVFAPEVLAELFDVSALRASLQPLVDGLRHWIENEQLVASTLGKSERDVAESQVLLARAACARIADGIDTLCADADARRAFCFANKAIAMQSKWAKRSPDAKANSWFPFQLAFQLMTIRGLADPTHSDRKTCDLLWFPTGGGKTEAYLGLTAFVLALRRVRALRAGNPFAGSGTAVLSRYTLRLLTIQQFRRAVALVTACELLRVSQHSAGGDGWRPTGDVEEFSSNPWGTVRFSIGLWVGSQVTPAGLHDIQFKSSDNKIVTIPGALSILTGKEKSASEPAQMSNCPCCGTLLAIQGEGLSDGQEHSLHLVICDAPEAPASISISDYSDDIFSVKSIAYESLAAPGFATLSIRFTAAKASTDFASSVDRWWKNTIRQRVGGHCDLAAARASRPGYFIRLSMEKNRAVDYEFEVYCPSPTCELANNVVWRETLPAAPWAPPEAFAAAANTASRCPIPVWTIDSQVYHRLPSMVVATVDKFARLTYESRTAGMFGNVTHHHPLTGWFRSNCPPATKGALPKQLQSGISPGVKAEGPLTPPDLIIQDELHLIEGPLGSMVGLYETAIDELCTRIVDGAATRPKYVASTATAREAGPQVRSLFNRGLSVFPVSGTTIDDSFFARSRRLATRDDLTPGRLYVGICTPGRGAQTPIVRIWSRLLQTAYDRQKAGADNAELDGLWTLIGYFNAIRELAGARTLCEQDIPQRLSFLADPRQIEVEELSSRTSSNDLPGKLDALERALPDDPQDVVLTTSMFGTGVDVARLRLMFVSGQPKSTSSYIQATGRVGRQKGGLVVTFFRSSRPRDLNHYEFFVGYHDAIYRHVEPITVNPFSERARDRALGPVAVALLRNAPTLHLDNTAIDVDGGWRLDERLEGGWQSAAGRISAHRTDPDVEALPAIFEARAAGQPNRRRPETGTTLKHMKSELDRWKQVAELNNDILYSESSSARLPEHAVVLGDLAHAAQGLDVAFENAPNSLREVESTVTFRGRS